MNENKYPRFYLCVGYVDDFGGVDYLRKERVTFCSGAKWERWFLKKWEINSVYAEGPHKKLIVLK